MRSPLLVPVVITILFGQFAVGQNKRPAADPQDKDRKVKPEPDRALTDWLRDVGPIISKEEDDAFRKLRTNDERERFIEMFWRVRDPDPDTEENEYREAYYERVAYVNEHFTSGIPGYKTDRGRVYLKYGKPDDVDSHPAGGAYQRDPAEGGGSTSTYPFERWFYRNIPGRAGADIEFVDPTGTGEYRLARNPFEKDAMLRVPGAAPATGGISQGDLAAAANGVGNPFSFREADSPFSWMELQRILNSPPPPPLKNDPFVSKLTGSDVVIEDNPLHFEAAFGFFRLDENRVVTTITVQAENAELSFHDSGGVQVASANIVGRILNVAGRRVNFFEDVVTTTASPQELVDAKARKSAYQKTIVLGPGHYKADLIVRDTNTGATGLRHIGFTVPKFGSELSVSSIILCSVLQKSEDPSSRQFTIGDQKVIPNISARFHRGAPIGIYLQIYNAGTDQTTLRPSAQVEYTLFRDGKQIQKQTEDWRNTKMNGDRLNLSRLIGSDALTPGNYAIEVRVSDQVSGQSLVRKENFTVVP
jgi:GWxTD domain-containing protein